ncbi:hypothetical protein EK904_010359, partial [Melospiza melodia maxima]
LNAIYFSSPPWNSFLELSESLFSFLPPHPPSAGCPFRHETHSTTQHQLGCLRMCGYLSSNWVEAAAELSP